MRLVDVLAENKGKTVMIGVRSSFFFVGPSEEALLDLHAIGIMARCCVALAAGKDKSRYLASSDDIGERRVLKTYLRSPDYCDDVVIIVSGREFGAFWTRDEYLAGRKILESAMESAKTASRKSASV